MRPEFLEKTGRVRSPHMSLIAMSYYFRKGLGNKRWEEEGVIAPSEAWEMGEGCNDYTAETFRRDSVGI